MLLAVFCDDDDFVVTEVPTTDCPWLTSVLVVVLLPVPVSLVVLPPVISFAVSFVVVSSVPVSSVLTSKLAFCEFVSVWSDVVVLWPVSVMLNVPVMLLAVRWDDAVFVVT